MEGIKEPRFFIQFIPFILARLIFRQQSALGSVVTEDVHQAESQLVSGPRLEEELRSLRHASHSLALAPQILRGAAEGARDVRACGR